MIKSAHHSAYVTLTAQLKRVREEAGLSVREVGKRLGEEHSFVSKVESQERKLSAIEYLQYTAAIGLSEDDAIALLKKMNSKL